MVNLLYTRVHNSTNKKTKFDSIPKEIMSVSHKTNDKYTETYVNIKGDALEKYAADPSLFTFRSDLLAIVSIGYSNIISDYVKRQIKKCLNNLLDRCENEQHDNISKTLTYYTPKYKNIQIGNKYVDLNSGDLISKINISKIQTNGRIIIGSNLEWIDTVRNIKHKHNPDKSLIMTNATLVVGDEFMLSYWHNKTNGLLICNNKDHNCITYSDIQEQNYVLVDIDYINSRRYGSLSSNYKLKSMNNRDALIQMIKDYVKYQDKIMDTTRPHLSAFNWYKIVICLPKNYDITSCQLSSLRGSQKWLHMIDLFDMYTNMENYVKFMFNDTIIFPLLTLNKKAKDLTKIFSFYTFIDTQFNPVVNKISISDERTLRIINYVRDKIDRKIIPLFVDKLYTNKVPKVYNAGDTCNICINKVNNEDYMTIDCGHTICIDCILMSLDTGEARCPFCRHNFAIDDIMWTHSNMNLYDKYNILINAINSNNHLVLISGNVHIYDRLKEEHKNIHKCTGSLKSKSDKINKFNNSGNMILYISPENFQFVSLISIPFSIFYFTYPHKLSKSFFGNIKTLNTIYIPVYKNTIEETLIDKQVSS
jgi:hypothetical protein